MLQQNKFRPNYSHVGAIQGQQKKATCIVKIDFEQLVQVSTREEWLQSLDDLPKAQTIKDISNIQTLSTQNILAMNVITIAPCVLTQLDQVTRQPKGHCKLVLFAVFHIVDLAETEMEGIEDEVKPA